MPLYRTTRQIAKESGVHVRTVRRFLKRHYPRHHYYREWWKLDEHDYLASINALKCAKIACPCQPLHALESGQSFLPLF